MLATTKLHDVQYRQYRAVVELIEETSLFETFEFQIPRVIFVNQILQSIPLAGILIIVSHH